MTVNIRLRRVLCPGFQTALTDTAVAALLSATLLLNSTSSLTTTNQAGQVWHHIRFIITALLLVTSFSHLDPIYIQMPLGAVRDHAIFGKYGQKACNRAYCQAF